MKSTDGKSFITHINCYLVAELDRAWTWAPCSVEWAVNLEGTCELRVKQIKTKTNQSKKTDNKHLSSEKNNWFENGEKYSLDSASFFSPKSHYFPTSENKQAEDSQEWKQLSFPLLTQNQACSHFVDQCYPPEVKARYCQRSPGQQTRWLLSYLPQDRQHQLACYQTIKISIMVMRVRPCKCARRTAEQTNSQSVFFSSCQACPITRLCLPIFSKMPCGLKVALT